MTFKRRLFVNTITINGNSVLVQPTRWFWAQLLTCEQYALILNSSILTNILPSNRTLLYLPRRRAGSTTSYKTTRPSTRSARSQLPTNDSILIQKKTLKNGSTNTTKCSRGSRSSTPKTSLISTKRELELGVLDLKM
jgi:hypothetical protein